MAKGEGISVKAIAFGLLADIGGSLVVMFIFGIIVGIVLASQGVPREELEAQFMKPSILIVSIIIGFGFTFLGGFVAGKVAKRSQVLHAGIVGGIGVVIGLFFAGSYPLWFNAVCFIGTVPIAMAGGYLSK